FFVVHDDRLEVAGHVEHALALLVGRPGFLEVGPETLAELLGLAHVNGPARVVLKDVDARLVPHGLRFGATGLVHRRLPDLHYKRLVGEDLATSRVHNSFWGERFVPERFPFVGIPELGLRLAFRSVYPGAPIPCWPHTPTGKRHSRPLDSP